MKTALQVIAAMTRLPHYVADALKYARHPQERTRAFHRFYGAPIHDQRPDATFSHMSDERVAFRAAFIVSEAMELLEKGLGIKMSVQLEATHSGYSVSSDLITDEKLLASDIAGLLRGNDKPRNIVEVVDALGDLNVVVNGFAIELGVDMHVVDQEVCASNFTKMGEDGNPIIGDGTNGPVGKVLKGPNFTEPQIAAVLGRS